MYVELVRDHASNRLRHVLLSWLATAATCGYLFPWAVAVTRGKSNADVIGVLNFAFGWTIVGWFAAFGMALGKHPVLGLRLSDLPEIASRANQPAQLN